MKAYALRSEPSQVFFADSDAEYPLGIKAGPIYTCNIQPKDIILVAYPFINTEKVEDVKLIEPDDPNIEELDRISIMAYRLSLMFGPNKLRTETILSLETTALYYAMFVENNNDTRRAMTTAWGAFKYAYYIDCGPHEFTRAMAMGHYYYAFLYGIFVEEEFDEELMSVMESYKKLYKDIKNGAEISDEATFQIATWDKDFNQMAKEVMELEAITLDWQ